MNSLLDLESVVKLWCNKEIHESNSTYGVYGATENYRLDSSHKPKVTVDNVKYKPRRPIQLPGLTFTEWSDNATNEPVYSKFMKSTTVESTRSASVTNGINIGFGVGASVNIEYASANMSFNTCISTSSTKSETTSKSETWSVDKSVTIPPNTSVEMIWSIGEEKLDIDFTADVSIIGFVWAKGETEVEGGRSSSSKCSPLDTFFTNDLPLSNLLFPAASNFKPVKHRMPSGADWKETVPVKFTLQGTLSGQNGVSSTFQANEHPLHM